MNEWYTAAELVALKLPGLPATVRGMNLLSKREGWAARTNLRGDALARRRRGRGGGWEYHYSVLPQSAQAALVKRSRPAAGAPVDPRIKSGEGHDEKKREARASDLWDWYERQAEKKKRTARDRLDALLAVEALERGGLATNLAVFEVARQRGTSASSVYGWRRLVAGVPRPDWLPRLCPRHAGRTATVECDPAAWEMLKGDWLRIEQPTFESCYLRLERAAAERGWQIPSRRTLQRRLDMEIPHALQVLQREGKDALRRMYPPQERDRSMYHALQAVNADGHIADVWVQWPGVKEPVRPLLLVVQDLYSNMIVGWRAGLSESAHLVQLAFGDVFRDFGIPEIAYLDNGRAFASKKITGGAPTRHRFKVKSADPDGLLTQLGVKVHWTTPYSGQSKPIERSFRDLCDHLWRSPAFAGAWTGNRPDAKPENYRSKAVPYETFLQEVSKGIALFNAREGRRTRVCGGVLSFKQAFENSYREAPVTKARPEHLRLCLMTAEAVTVRAPSAMVHVLGNRYWAGFLPQHMGRKVIVRFDPAALHEGVEVCRLDGAYLGFAECWEASGFGNVEDARTHSRARRKWMRAWLDMRDAEITLSAEQVAALDPALVPEPTPEPSVVRPFFGNAAPKLAPEPAREADTETMTEEEFSAAMRRGLEIVVNNRDEA